ncbi:MAG: cofactor-independent phosphoglycerate mutase [Candidatus Aureabacteria bacterium]|nr:cofactor-independent phosphoglycerate mutase [Candidatus Auribacterota bacterium]
MKYALIIPDGMADYPIHSLEGKTPLEVAHTPFMDEAAAMGEIGLCYTTPKGLHSGSDVCILSLLGYDAQSSYSGRAPLEAASLEISMEPQDVVMRCNLIHVNEKEEIQDHCAGHITTEEARPLIEALQNELGSDSLRFHAGVSYRHILAWKNKPGFDYHSVPPHDVPGEPIKKHLPSGKDASFLTELLFKSRRILENHPVNLKRNKKGKLTANSIWLWGAGYKPTMEKFKDKFGLSGCVISAVDLIRGLGKLLDLNIISVPGITGYFDTDYEAKGRYGIESLKQNDLLIIHIEAPDEAGHIGNVQEKIHSIEQVDRYIVGPILQYLKNEKDFRLLISPDHYTPINKKTHTADPVPFLLCRQGKPHQNALYNEKEAKNSRLVFKKGYELMPYFLFK